MIACLILPFLPPRHPKHDHSDTIRAQRSHSREFGTLFLAAAGPAPRRLVLPRSGSDVPVFPNPRRCSCASIVRVICANRPLTLPACAEPPHRSLTSRFGERLKSHRQRPGFQPNPLEAVGGGCSAPPAELQVRSLPLLPSRAGRPIPQPLDLRPCPQRIKGGKSRPCSGRRNSGLSDWSEPVFWT